MKRYYKRKPESVDVSIPVPTMPVEKDENSNERDNINVKTGLIKNIEANLEELEYDHGLRIPITDYNVNIQDEVRRRYMLRSPCQPKLANNQEFPLTKFGKKYRRFNQKWFKYHSSWLEYSIAKNAAYCLCCYLFKEFIGEDDAFVCKGYSNWKKNERFGEHVGGLDSAHSYAWLKSVSLLNQEQHISTFFNRESNKDQAEYRLRLESSVNVVRFLLRQGLPFRGHDETIGSTNQGNFLELLKFMGFLKKEIKYVTLHNAPENAKLVSLEIQKDIVNAIATETINVIVKNMGNSLFSILVDESRDISMKEQMAVFLRYVDKNGCVIEPFVGLEHVPTTTALALKAAIGRLFSRYGLSMTRLRRQISKWSLKWRPYITFIIDLNGVSFE